MTGPLREGARDPRLDDEPGLAARALVWLARTLLPLPPAPPSQISTVLVVRTDDRVGNALLTLPLVRAVQRALPGARVDLLLAARRAPVAEGLPGIHVVRFEKTDAFRHPLRFARALLALRRYDVVIDAAHWHAFSLTSALLSRWAARGWLIGPARGPSIYSVRAPLPAEGTPEVAAKVALALPLGAAAQPLPPLETALGRTPLPAGFAPLPAGLAPSHAESAPLPAGPARYVALNPGARKADHRASPLLFGALAQALWRRRGVRSVVLWGPGEEEVARQVVAAAPEACALAPATSLDQLAAVLRGAALVVTNDTGPMHLAVACGAPVLGLFLDAAGLRWAHPGPRFAAVLAGAGVAAPALDAVLAPALTLLDTAVPPSEPPPPMSGIPAATEKT